MGLPLRFLKCAILVTALVFGASLNAQNRIIVNPSFETGSIVPHTDVAYPQSQTGPNPEIDGWYTNHPDVNIGGLKVSPIEHWASGFQSTPAQNGGYFVELNVSQPARLYQIVYLVNGESIDFEYFHRRRLNQTETIEFNIYNETGTTKVATLSTHTATGSVWDQISGSATFNGASGVYQIGFEAVAPATGGSGNFLDNVTIGLDGIVEFSKDTMFVSESQAASFMPHLLVNGEVLGASSVNFSVSTNGATQGVDFTLASNTLNVPVADYAVQDSLSLGLAIVDDQIAQGDRSFTLTISSVSGSVDDADANGDGFKSSLTVVIQDDDPAPGGVVGTQLWLDASDVDGDGNAGNNPADGTDVTTWVDKSGNGNNCTTAGITQGGVNPPSYLNNQFNGAAALRFDKSNSESLGKILSSSYTGPLTVFIVLQSQTTTPANFDSFFSSWNTPSNASSFQIDYDGSSSFQVRTTAGLTKFGPVNQELDLYTVRYSSNSLETFSDGTLENTGAQPTDLGFNAYRVGVNRNGGSYYDSKIAEVIVYHRALTDCELEQVTNYLGAKYGRDYTNVAANFDFDGTFPGNVTGIGAFASNCTGLTTIDTARSSILTLLNPSSNDTQDEFLTIGHDNGSTAETGTNVSLDLAGSLRIGRTWKADRDGDVGTVDAVFDLNGLSVTGMQTSDFILLIDNDGDGDFSTGSVTEIPATSFSASSVGFTGVTLPDGAAFTLVTFDDEDFDNDGVANAQDVDDDNDGIFDVDEGFGGVAPATPLSSVSYTASQTAANGPSIGTPSTGYQITDTSTPGVFSFTATAPGESGSGGGTGTVSRVTIDVDFAPQEVVSNVQVSVATGAFDDGLFLEVNGTPIVNFDQSDWDNSTFNAKFGNGSTWTPWTNQGSPALELDLINGEVRLMVNVTDGTSPSRQDALAFISGSKPNPVPSVDFEAGVTIGSAYQNASGPGSISTQTLTFSADVSTHENSGSGFWDFQNLDSDGDGCFDVVEAGFLDPDNDGMLGTSPVTVDADGRVTSATDGYTTPRDGDGNGTKDFQEAGSQYTITTQPQPATTDVGVDAPMTVAASGSPIDVQWQVSTDGGATFSDIADGAEYSGTQTASLTIIAPEVAKDTNRYRAVVNNSAFLCDPDTSNSAVLSVIPAPGGVSGLGFWLRGNADLVSNAGAVSSWADQTGNYSTVINGNPSEVVNGINGYRSVAFDGTGDYVSIPYEASLNPNQFTFYTAVKANSGGTGYEAILSCKDGNFNGYVLYINRTGSNNQFEWWVANNSSGWTIVQGPTVQNDEWYLITSSFDGTNLSLFINGEQVGGPTATTFTANSTAEFRLGMGHATDLSPSFPFVGEIVEALFYGSTQTSSERNQIESYLAVKYGFELAPAVGQYVNSSGTTLWDDTNYWNDVFGVGHDNTSTLNTVRSNPVFTGTGNFVGKSGEANVVLSQSNSILAEGTFAMLGHDGAPLSENASDVPENIVGGRRLHREWKIKKTGQIDSLNLTFNVNGLNIKGTNRFDFTLLIDNDGDGDFKTGFVTQVRPSVYSGGYVAFENLNIPDGAAIALSTFRLKPGFVPGSILWYSASNAVKTAGTLVNQWDNLGSAYDIPALASGASRPTYVDTGSKMINFHPVLSFDGNDDFMKTDPFPGILGLDSASGNMEATQFYVFRNNGLTRPVLSVENTSGELKLGSNSFGFISQNAGAGFHLKANQQVPYLFDMSASTSSNLGTNTFNHQRNGNQNQGVNNNFVSFADALPVNIGRTEVSPPSYGNIDLATALIFPRVLTQNQRRSIQSFICLKFGLSLGDNQQAEDYYFLTGDTIWNANPSYYFDVFGIGSIDTVGFVQSISNSMNTGSGNGVGQPGKGNIVISNPDDFDEFEFLMLGHNNDTLTDQLTEMPSSLANSCTGRFGREWLIQRRGDPGAIDLSLDLNGISFTGTLGSMASEYGLMIDTDGDGDFTTGSVTTVAATSLNGDLVEFSGVNLPNDAIMTFYFQLDNAQDTSITVNSCGPFVWGMTGQTINTSGVYVDTATNSFGCDSVVTLNLSVFQTPDIIGHFILPESCNGAGDGLIAISVSGGTAPYTYNWSSIGAGSSVIAGLSPGTYTVTATDANGCTVSDSYTVSTDDYIPPVAVCVDTLLYLDANGQVIMYPSEVDGGSTDNCGSPHLSVSPSLFDCGDLGVNLETLWVEDFNGNVDTCKAQVTIVDTTAPVAICQDLTVQLIAGATALITGIEVDGGSTDNCSIQSYSVSPNSFSCSDVGVNTVTLTVTDGSGNTSTCTANVTVQDLTVPTAVCQDITIQLDASGQAQINASDVDGGSTNVCGIASLSVSQSSFDCTHVGPNTVTLTVTGNNGNTSTCTATVTVEDNIAPQALCQNITVQLDANGQASITTANIDNGSNDNCGVANIGLDVTDFTCADAGANSVTLTVTDVNGNVSTCTATVTVVDNIAPTAVCQDITIALDANGMTSIAASDVDGGSSDNCSIQSLAVSPNTFNCTNLGANTVVLVVTDASGNQHTCNAQVTVVDNTVPTARCQDIQVTLDSFGGATITTADIDNGSTDNCSVASISLDVTSFDCNDLGANTVTMTVEDQSGNQSTCVATVTVVDQINPVALAQDVTVQLDASGDASVTTADIDNGSLDNCTVTNLSLDIYDFDCNDVGPNTVTLTATDQSGNSNSVQATVTVEDNIAPTAICQNFTVDLDVNGDASIAASDINNGSSDNCSIASLAVSPNTFTCSDLGDNTVTLTVTDVNGNISTCTSIVTVEDTIHPLLACQDYTLFLDGSGGPLNLTADDNCSFSLVTVTPSSLGCNDLGANTVSVTIEDQSNNQTTCTMTVTVVDNIDPVAVCQNLTVQLDASGNASISTSDIDNGSSDNCTLTSLSLDKTSFTCSDVGSNTVTLTATDQSGNTSTCTATVTIEDNVDPTALCQDVTVQLDAAGAASISTSDIDAGSSDACGIANISVSPSTFTCSDIGVNTVTLTVTDVNGNSSSCTATVTVEDNVDPTALCQDVTVQLDAAGSASISTSDIDNGSSDNCSIANISVSPSSFTCANLGGNTVTLTVTDVNGNSSFCTSTVTVEDTTPPQALCQGVTVQLDATGNASISTSDIDNGSNDNCTVVSITLDKTSFNCSETGANTVNLTVTDQSGNSSSCSATVTVEDVIYPVASCQDITVQLDATGNVSIAGTDVDGGSTDNCSISTYDVTPSSFTCANTGDNTVTLTVTDASGNTNSCTANVTVENNNAPTALCQDITVQLDASGTVTIVGSDVDAGSTEICGIASTTVSPNSFTCANLGGNTVTLTVTDVNGNVSTCTAIVTVEDVIAPITQCQDIVVALDGSGQVSISTAQIDNGSSDNCTIANMSLDQTSFDCSEVGSNTVTLTVTDQSGNSSSCTANVTVQDNISPTALCQNINVYLDASGSTTVAATDIDFGSTDNCGIADYEINGGSSVNYTCSDVGPQNVTLQVTDDNGNSSSCLALITVIDTVDPTAVCQDVTVFLDGSGNVTIIPVDIDGGSTDACGLSSYSASTTSFTCADLGPNNVTLTVTDNNGNSANCVAVVTVVDSTSPVVSCQDVTIQLDGSGIATVAPAAVDNGSVDNCTGSPSLSLDQSSFDCNEVGANTVTLTATDGSGNQSSCTATVTVEDNVAPTAICQDITVDLDISGNVSISGTDVDGGSTDNCAIASYAVSPSTFTCAELGANTVTLTVTDVNGNVSTCTSSVTVEDTINPLFLCQDYTLNLDGSGGPINLIAADNCDLSLVSVTPSSLGCNDLGDNTVSITIEDAGNNQSTCTLTVTVVDNIDPVAVCQNVTVQLDASGNGSISTSDVDNGSSDNCTLTNLSLDKSSFNCSEVGANTVTLTATDQSGNTNSCTATVTVVDYVDPTPICQNITVQLDASGDATITTSDIDNGSNDACGIQSMSIDVSSFDCNDVGPNTVTLTVVDVNGNSSSCTSTVTVEDNIAPQAQCQDYTAQLPFSNTYTLDANNVDNGSNDACGVSTISVSPNTFDQSNLGANTVTLTVTDVNGNTSTCTATFTLTSSAPTALCKDVTVQLDAAGQYHLLPSEVDNGSSNNYGVPNTLDVVPQYFDCSNVGPNVVVLTVTDDYGQSDQCTATVTVVDNTAPIAICQDLTLTLDGSNQASLTAAMVDNGSSDACGIAALSIDKSIFDCSVVGQTTVTLTVTDNNGNMATCTSNVTVIDANAPIAICQDLTVNLDASGTTSIAASDIDSGSNDACSLVSISVSPSTFNCSNVGANVVVLTVEDASGNQTSCSANVTVLDVTDPVAIAQDITVALDASGQAIVTTADIDNGSSDECPGVQLSLSQPVTTTTTTIGTNSTNITSITFTCLEIGPNTVTLTATDASGNTSMATATVTVVDNTPPTITCQSWTYSVGSGGSVSVDPNDLVSAVADNCGPVTLTTNISGFNCTQLGTYSVLVTATDASGNSSSCYSTVTVNDLGGPTVSCQDVTIVLDATGQATISTSDVNAGSGATCGNIVLALSQTQFDCSDLGVNTVVLTGTDANGTSGTCTALVTVVDVTPPVALCQDIDVYLDANGIASMAASDINNGSYDHCGPVSISASQTQFDCSELGKNDIMLLVTDGSGNTATCMASVTVKDTIAPSITCINPTMNMGHKGWVSFNSDQLATAADNCGSVTITSSTNIFYCQDVGIQTVVVTATDASGNSTTCSSTVNVVDLNPPIIWCQPATLVLDANGSAQLQPMDVLDQVAATCGIDTMWVTPSQFDCSDVGAQSVVVTVVANSGISATCAAQVTVTDQTAPTVTCAPATAYLDANGQPVISGGINITTTDNCGIQSTSYDLSGLDCSTTTPQAVAVVVTDLSGNTTTCTSMVTVLDTMAPQIACMNMTVQLDASGQVTVDQSQLAMSSDNCGTVQVSPSSITFDCSQTGIQTVVLTATDGSGNTSTCTATVNVVDNVAPVLACKDTTVTIGLSGQVVLSASDLITSVSDECGPLGYSISQSTFDCNDVGTHTVTILVTDPSGNSSTCASNVTIDDLSAPSITCNPDISVNNDPGICGAVVTFADATAVDGCGATTVQRTDNTGLMSGDVFPVGTTIISYEATDASGNAASCSFTITVTDNEAPSFISCTSDITVNNDLGVGGAAVMYIVPQAQDNCPNVSIALAGGLASGSVFPIGVTEVIYVATDGVGLTDTCSFTVTVVDNAPPQVQCPANQSLFNDLGICGAVVNFNDPSVIGNIGGGPVTISRSDATGLISGDVFPVGITTLTWVISDSLGNASICSMNITVADNELPSVVCPADMTFGNDPGQCGAVVTFAAPIATDNCPGVTVTQTGGPASGSFVNVGTSIVTWTITDAAGNGTSCSMTITVEDTEPPVLTCPSDITIQSDTVNCGAIVNYVLPTATDNCPGQIQGAYSGINPTNYYPVGTTTIIFTATDVAGNVSVCSFDVTVVNNFQLGLGPDTTGCGPITLAPVAPSGGAYLWNTGETTPTISVTQSGTYWVEASYPGGCWAADTINVTVLPDPVVSMSGLSPFYCSTAGPVTLTGSPAGGTFTGVGVSGNVFDPATAGLGTFTVYYTYTGSNGCDGSIQQQVTVENCVGIDEFDIVTANLYPNPASSEVTIDWVMSTPSDVTIRVYNTLGQIIYEAEVLKSETPEHRMNATSWPSGNYTITLENRSGVLRKRLVITK